MVFARNGLEIVYDILEFKIQTFILKMKIYKTNTYTARLYTRPNHV
jgi:hypothetical protein